MRVLPLYTYAEFGVVAASFLPLVALARALEPDDVAHRRAGRMLRRMGRAMVKGSPLWRFGVEGTVPADIAERAYVVVANHASIADPFLLSHVPWDMRFVAKEELFRAPLIGWLLRLAGDIPLRRGDKDSVAQMYEACRHTLRAGLSVMLFPEGTRSRDGHLGELKDGAFRLAIEAQVPVLPIALHGTHRCVTKRGVERAQARAQILAPIDTRGMRLEAVSELKQTVHAKLAAALGSAPAPALLAADTRAPGRSPCTQVMFDRSHAAQRPEPS